MNILVRLEQHASGANAHTANKARMYIQRAESFASGKEKGWASKDAHQKLLTELTDLAEGAINHGKWKDLDDRMRGWW